jgi:hypothetical protein
MADPGPFDRIYDDVKKDIPGVPTPVVKQCLFRVMDDFTQTTNVWQEMFLISVVPEHLVYNLPVPKQGKHSRLLRVSNIGSLIDGAIDPTEPVLGAFSKTAFDGSAFYVDGGIPGYPETGPSVISYLPVPIPIHNVSMRVPGIVVCSRPPSAAVWSLVVAKRTYDPVTETGYPAIDDWIVEKYADTIGLGVMARLQFMPQKPWTNPMLGQVNQRGYISGRSIARANDEHDNVLNAQNWHFPQGWATTKRGFT